MPDWFSDLRRDSAEKRHRKELAERETAKESARKEQERARIKAAMERASVEYAPMVTSVLSQLHQALYGEPFPQPSQYNWSIDVDDKAGRAWIHVELSYDNMTGQPLGFRVRLERKKSGWVSDGWDEWFEVATRASTTELTESELAKAVRTVLGLNN